MVEKGTRYGPGTEKHVGYATSVSSVQGAFEFVMRHLDEFTEPRIEIHPKRSKSETEEETTVEFDVAVSGLVQT